MSWYWFRGIIKGVWRDTVLGGLLMAIPFAVFSVSVGGCVLLLIGISTIMVGTFIRDQSFRRQRMWLGCLLVSLAILLATFI